jgi:hypothetical protein
MRRSENADFFHDDEAVPRPQRLCYSNCDILLMQDFSEALGRLKEAHSKFLMVGRWRWAAVKRYMRQAWRVLFHEVIQRAWFLVLGITRPARRALGLRAGTLPRSREKV